MVSRVLPKKQLFCSVNYDNWSFGGFCIGITIKFLYYIHTEAI